MLLGPLQQFLVLSVIVRTEIDLGVRSTEAKVGQRSLFIRIWMTKIHASLREACSTHLVDGRNDCSRRHKSFQLLEIEIANTYAPGKYVESP